MSNPAARETLETLLGHLGLVFELEESEDGGRPRFNIRTNEPNRLVGREGQTLDDLQYLLNRILSNEEGGATHVTVDVEGYRLREQQDFLGEIKDYADRVRRSGDPFVLQPMNSFDRRLVHQEFAEDPEISTVSEEGNNRLKSITLIRRKK
jgi:spoIIIJ-associated protein